MIERSLDGTAAAVVAAQLADDDPRLSYTCTIHHPPRRITASNGYETNSHLRTYASQPPLLHSTSASSQSPTMANLTSPSNITINPPQPPIEYGIFPENWTASIILVSFCYEFAFILSALQLVLAVAFILDPSGRKPDSRASSMRPVAKYWGLSGFLLLGFQIPVLCFVPAGNVVWSLAGVAAIVLVLKSGLLLMQEMVRREGIWIAQQRCRGCGYAGWKGHDRFCGECGVAGPYVKFKEDHKGCKGCGATEEIKAKFCLRCGTAGSREVLESLGLAEEGEALGGEKVRWSEKEKLLE